MRSVVPSLGFLFVAVVVACAPVVGGCGLDEEPSAGSGGSAGKGGAGGAAGKGGAGSAGKAGSVGSGGAGTTTASGVGGTAGSAGSTGAGGSAGAGSGAAGTGGTAGGSGAAGTGGAAGSSGGAAGSGGGAGSGGTAGSSGAAGTGGAAGSSGAGGAGGAAGSGDAGVDSGRVDASIDASIDAAADVSTDRSVEAGPSGDAAVDTGSSGDTGQPDSGTGDATADAAASDGGDAACTGSTPSAPDGGGNAANVAQGGSVLLGGNCGGVSADETPLHAFDNSVQSKWLCFVQASDAFAVPPVTYRLAGGSTNAVNAYTITSANDAPDRDPASWRLEGSLDEGATWATLDTQVGQTFANRFQTNSYVISNCAAYGRYRFVVTATAGGLGSGAIFQVAEFQLFGPQGHGPTDPTNRALGGTVTTPSTCAGGSANEAPDKAFDGDLGSKWFCGSNTAPSIDIALTASRAITSYAITNGNDAPDRDPKSWTLQGSNDADAGTWTTLDTQTNQAFANRNQTLTYTFTNATSYANYRFVVTANNGSVDFQVGEIMLFGN